MMDAAVAGRDVALVHDEAKRAKTLRRFNLGDRTFKVITQISAVTVLALLAGVMLALLHGSLLTWQTFGLDFLFTEKWNPVTEKFGALAPIYGTLVTSTIAMLIGVPVSLGIAFFLTEISPERLRRPIGIAIELLAGIPSIIYGIWGLFVFAPWFQATVQPFLIDTFANVPLLNQLFAGPPYGIGMLPRVSSSPSWCFPSSLRSPARCSTPFRRS
jgi:phosphate transport system permease protein